MEILAFPLTPFATNCFVARSPTEAIVIDPGEVTEQLIDAIQGRTVVAIINTHCHCDHCGGNARLKALTGAELLCHEAELPLLRMLEQQGLMFGVPFEPSPDPDRFLKVGEIIRGAAASLQVLFTPGHSPGHVSLLGDGFVFSGDVLFAGSIGRTDLPGGSHARLMQSIREELLALPDDTIVYCGHGPATTIGAERRSNPFLAEL